MSFRSIITVFVALGLLAEWSQTLRANGQSRPDSSAVQIESIAVMPFFEGISGYDATEMLDSPVSRRSFDQENISGNAVQIISRHVQEALIDHHGTRVVRLRESTEVYEQMGKDETRDTPRFLAQKLGKELKVSHIMIGTVWRYRERIGGSYGVERPAAIAFAVYLIDVANGKLLWAENFEETQRSLSENLLAAPTFLRRRGRWLSAMELTEYGIKEIFSRYPF
jgi:TolB-like protein